MQARDIMTAPVFTVRDTATVGEAAALLAEHRISALPILDAQDRLVGILTHTDFFLHPIRYPGAEGSLFELLGSLVGPDNLEHAARELKRRSVRDVMSKPVTTIREDTPVSEIARIMIKEKRKRLPVTRDGMVVGIVCRHDFLKLLAD